MKLVIVCHYFPPHNSCGVRRVLFWANFLANNGHNITVLTSKKIKRKIRPQHVHHSVKIIDFSYGKLRKLESGKLQDFAFAANNKSSLFIKIATQIKRKIFNPTFGQILDPNIFSVLVTIATLFWQNLMANKSTRDIFDNSLILSTSPPWSMHLLGLSISKIFKLPLIIDYRDQFSENHMFGGYFGFLEKKLDIMFCKFASKIITVSPSMKKYYSQFNNEVEIIMNGYDPQLFWPSDVPPNEICVIRYFGSIHHKSRLPVILFEGLKEKIRANKQNYPKLRVEFFGDVPLVEAYLLKNPELKEIVMIKGNLPLTGVRSLMASADYNLMCETMEGETLSHRGVMTTKLFEYLAVQRPVLAIISPFSDVIKVLKKSGMLVGPFQSTTDILHWLENYNLKQHDFMPNIDYITSLSRVEGAETLIKLLNQSYEN